MAEKKRGVVMAGVAVRAYAKINLILDVLKKREDGYHEVEMIMQAISLHDLLTIEPKEGITITSNHPAVPLDERNFAYQAARLIIDKYPHIPGALINIDKNIPIEAGLAGGSTDAAGVILGLNQLYNLNMEKTEILRIAAQIGSDVPFCIGGPTALARGRGEIIEEITPCPRLWVVLVKPAIGVKTAEVYGNLNINEIANYHPNLRRYLKALEESDIAYLLSNTGNILEYSTFRLYPQVRHLKAKLKNLGVQSILMSGSGPTVFALFTSQAEARALVDRLKRGSEYQVWITHTMSREELNERVKML